MPDVPGLVIEIALPLVYRKDLLKTRERRLDLGDLRQRQTTTLFQDTRSGEMPRIERRTMHWSRHDRNCAEVMGLARTELAPLALPSFQKPPPLAYGLHENFLRKGFARGFDI